MIISTVIKFLASQILNQIATLAIKYTVKRTLMRQRILYI